MLLSQSNPYSCMSSSKWSYQHYGRLVKSSYKVILYLVSGKL